MAVYREGYKCIEIIEKASVQVFSDACDFGAPTKRGDKIWNTTKQLVEWYGDEGTRSGETYSTGKTIRHQVTLIDEWAVSDERKTCEEATDIYVVKYVTCTKGRCKGYEGYVTVYKK